MVIRIYAVIVTYNPDILLLEKQLISLVNQVSGIILVDNCSNNKIKIEQSIESKYPALKLTLNNENKGLGYAQNFGIREAIKSGATDVILLDQDSVFNNDCVKNLIEGRDDLRKQNNKVGAIGPLYFNEHTKEAYPISKYYGPFIKRFVPKDKPAEASFIIASGCLINVADLTDIGLMKEEFFIDYIDIEWCFRAKSKGYKLFAVPNALMNHAIGDDSFAVAGRKISNHSPLRRYYLCRNSIFMIKNKNIPLGYKIRELVVNILRLVIFFIFSNNRMLYSKYSIKGFSDGFKNVGGICPHKYS